MTAPILGIVGWKNSGKTTLVAKLIAHFSAVGVRVAAIKHAHHAFDIDHEGRDSYRYREAGASTVIVSSPIRVAIMKELAGAAEPSLEDLIVLAKDADLILVEGFKNGAHRKIEVRRLGAKSCEPLPPFVRGIRAVATDMPIIATAMPVFALDAVPDIANFIARDLGLPFA